MTKRQLIFRFATLLALLGACALWSFSSPVLTPAKLAAAMTTAAAVEETNTWPASVILNADDLEALSVLASSAYNSGMSGWDGILPWGGTAVEQYQLVDAGADIRSLKAKRFWSAILNCNGPEVFSLTITLCKDDGEGSPIDEDALWIGTKQTTCPIGTFSRLSGPGGGLSTTPATIRVTAYETNFLLRLMASLISGTNLQPVDAWANQAVHSPPISFTNSGAARPSLTVLAGTNSVLFDGTTYLDAGDPAALNITNVITVMAWVKMLSSGNYPMLISRGYVDGYTLAFKSNERKPRFYFTAAAQATDADGAIETNAWYHIAASNDGTNTRYYINGVLDSTKLHPYKPSGAASHVIIGRAPDGGYPINAELDDVRIYSRVVSSNEIFTIKTATQK